MKRPIELSLLIALVWLQNSCNEHENFRREKVQFTITAADASGGLQSLADEEASVYKNGVRLYDYALGSGANQLSFEGDPNSVYSVIVKSEGYLPAAREFTYADMARSGETNLNITLQSVSSSPVFSVMPTGDFAFLLAMKESGKLTVDWGDGTVETISFSATELDPHTFRMMAHDYATNPYPIVITGDLDKIVEYHNDYYTYYSILEYINTTHLPALTHLFFSDCALKKLDLSKNPQLKFIGVGNSIDHLKFPKDHYIQYAAFGNLKQAKTNGTDALIDNIYENAVERSITDGYFNAVGMEPPPSAESLEKLMLLANIYRWNVSTD